MTTAIVENMQTGDTELVTASRAGNRQAFGQIVEKYQAMITGLIYSNCGDLQESEDLAQETFISAWKSLSGLREAGKLGAWLCQIARHRLLDHVRSAAREDKRLADSFHSAEKKTSSTPDSEMLSREEQDLLWRTLAEIDQPYRETLVLYYRQGQSTGSVAAAMDTTEAAVRQRLSRGRQMLREQVAVMIERDLARSAPRAAFTVAVVAALPAIIPQTLKAATIGAAAVKGGAAAGSGLLVTLSIWIGPVIGLMGGIFGTRASIRATQTPRERRFVMGSSLVIWIFVMGAMAALLSLIPLRRSLHWSGPTFVAAQVAFWAVYMVLLITLISVVNLRHHALRAKEGIVAPVFSDMDQSRHSSVWMILSTTVGSVAWMFALALEAHDLTTAAVLCVVVNVLIALGILITHGKSRIQTMRYMAWHTLLIGLITAIITNLRLHRWMAATGGITLAEAQRRVPFWAINLLLGVIVAGIAAMMWAMTRIRATGKNCP